MADAAIPVFAFGDLAKLLVALAITIALFGVMVIVMKKLQLGTGQGNSLIKVLAAVPLGGKEKIWLLEVGGERIVVGSSMGSVNCIHVLGRADASAVELEMPEAAPVSQPAPPAFAGKFADTLLTFIRNPKP